MKNFFAVALMSIAVTAIQVNAQTSDAPPGMVLMK